MKKGEEIMYNGEKCRIEEIIGEYCTLYSYKRKIFILSVYTKNI